MAEWFDKLKSDFILNFIESDRWLMLLKGLGVTLQVTFFALLIGITIGVMVSIIRSTYDKNSETMVSGIGKTM
ncbi:MAG: amino acid ABC transporter permease, partial [Oscillospiraceae bacterium]